MKKIIILILGIIILWGAFWAFSNVKNKDVSTPPAPVTEDVGNAEEKKDLIVVDTPAPNSILPSTFEVKGKARGNWFFEASFPVTLVAEDGTVLLDSYIMTDSEWMTENFVPFQKTFTFVNTSGSTNGTLILKKDNPSGLPANDDSLRIPVKFAAANESAGTTSVQVYFNRPLVGTESCDAIQTAVTRTIPKTTAVARAAILELLKGPASSDGNLETSIPEGVELKSIKIENGTAYADFNNKLTAGGSCRVTAIRAQIEDTLKQFATVKKVVISVDGRTADILQP